MGTTTPASAADGGLAALVGAVLEGRAEAIGTWFRREHPVVYRVCYGLLADAAEAEDAAQDAMVHLFDQLGRWDPERPYGGWRNAVVVNLCRDRLRRALARGRAERSFAERAAELEAPDASPQPSADPLRRAESAELGALLQRALEALTAREREVFVLRELEGEPTAEIARALGVTEGTVRSILTLARRRLRSVLGARLAPDGAGVERAGGHDGRA